MSHTSFIVYLPNLRFKVKVAFWNFPVLCQLVRLIRLSISFCTSGPEFAIASSLPRVTP